MVNKQLNALFGVKRAKAQPTETLGKPSSVDLMGNAVTNEVNPKLKNREIRYKTYSDMLLNTTIIGAGVRYFLNLVAKAEWVFTPSDDDTEGKYAELLNEILKKDPEIPFHRVVRRAAMYRFYGFSIQEWTALKRSDGVITFKNIAPRAQKTIDKWDVDEDGAILGVVQKNPINYNNVYIPRDKIVYLVDDTLDDNPEGVGLFRQLVEASERLKQYEKLEMIGFDTDLRGIPIGRGPFFKLDEMVQEGKLSKDARQVAEEPLRQFMDSHNRSSKLGLLLDSQPYTTEDEAQRPTQQREWDVEILKGGSTSLPDLAKAINRINREIARVLGVEQLLLGEEGQGSFALSNDKTQSFFMLVDGTLQEIKTSFERDIINTVWALNGWDEKYKPDVSVQAVQYRDVGVIAAAFRDLAAAGATLDPSDPAINELRDLLGVSRAKELDSLLESQDASLGAIASLVSRALDEDLNPSTNTEEDSEDE